MKTTLVFCTELLFVFLFGSLSAMGWQDSSPRALSGFEESESYDLEDDVLLDVNDANVIKLLYLVKKISRKNFEKYSQYSNGITLEDVQARPQKHRLWVFRISGVAKRAKQFKYENQGDGALKGCFQIDVETDQGNMVLVTRELPRAWQLDMAINEKVSFAGFFIANRYANQAAQEQSKTLPVFLALRPEWFPDESSQVSSPPRLRTSHQVLAARGVDIGRLDYVARQNFRRLTESDNESFYQFLSATRQMDLGEVPEVKLDFLDLMAQPKSNFGHATLINARVRRCVRVTVESEELRSRYGVGHYFELDMFYSLGNGTVTTRNREGREVIIEDRFPMTICVAQLPEGMSAEDVADHNVRVKGFYYRFWSYNSEFSSDHSDDPRLSSQFSPLVIGKIDQVIQSSSLPLDYVLTGFVVALMLGAAGTIWFFRRSDLQSKQTRRRQKVSSEDVDFGGIED